MKKLVIGIVILVLVYVGLLFFVKSSSKDVVANEVAQLNNNPQISASVESESSGLFSSTAVINVNSAADATPILKIKQTQSYGPVLFTEEGIKLGWYFINADLIPSEELKQEIPNTIDANDLFDIHFISGFAGSVQGDVYFKGLDFSDNDVQVNISAGEMHVDTDVTFEHLVGNAAWPGMTVTGKNEDGFTMNSVKLDFDQTLISGNLMEGNAIYTGEGTYSVGDIVFKQANNFFKMENFSVKGVADIENETSMNMAIEMKTDLVNVAGEKFTDSKLNMYFNGMDLDVLKKMGEISQEMQQAAMQGQDVSAYNMQLMNTMMQLAQKGPRIQMKDTQLITEDGMIKADMDIQVDQQKMDPNNPMAIMMALNAAFNAEAPEAFFAKKGMSPMIDQWAQMNFLVKEGDTLKVNATYSDGAALLNGQPMQGMPGM
ncbi:DUF945 family protein [Pleionea mediterranea]|jgi:uncharacterized protein YdgA (DUF945 family)|uniref:Uncharacterized protein YdgA (DUF945 family) n=1 Tax=Pleionea mediterranea TaxID=523701 RepID=A0A316FUA4_9GAMM|nr:DUF945 family protein [Pleionea mediterranea]PWK51862.1 uncharacterized protein YdgA (DUF945 family) [Pleionea mediterranea]